MKFILLFATLILQSNTMMAYTAQDFLKISKIGHELDMDVAALKHPKSQFKKNLEKVGLTPERQKKVEDYLIAASSASYAKMLQQSLTADELNILYNEANKVSSIFLKSFEYSQKPADQRLHVELRPARKTLIQNLLEESKDHEVYPGLPFETCVHIFANKYENLSDEEIISLTSYSKNQVVKKERLAWIQFHKQAMQSVSEVFTP